MKKIVQKSGAIWQLARSKTAGFHGTAPVPPHGCGTTRAVRKYKKTDAQKCADDHHFGGKRAFYSHKVLKTETDFCII
jgi:hypothetical protein